MRLRTRLALTAAMLPFVIGPVLADVPALDAGRLRRTLEAERGQVVLVNFWATWCRACLEEIPALVDLERQYRSSGLRLVSVSLDEPEGFDSVVSPFLSRWFPSLPTYRRAGGDMDDLVSVLDPAWNELLPTTYVLDRGGVVRARLQGGKSGAEFLAVIRPWLDAPAAGGGEEPR